MESTFMESTMDFFFSSTEIAFSKAIRLTILLHSVNLALASLSFGFTLVTYTKIILLIWMCRVKGLFTFGERECKGKNDVFGFIAFFNFELFKNRSHLNRFCIHFLKKAKWCHFLARFLSMWTIPNCSHPKMTFLAHKNVRSNLAIHLSDTPFAIR